MSRREKQPKESHPIPSGSSDDIIKNIQELNEIPERRRKALEALETFCPEDNQRGAFINRFVGPWAFPVFQCPDGHLYSWNVQLPEGDQGYLLENQNLISPSQGSTPNSSDAT